uniref:Uncharacterized protein n=1 Tax=Plectus sambesii TaxID=2011161 RepID=A0A914X5U9_9BILA
MLRMNDITRRWALDAAEFDYYETRASWEEEGRRTDGERTGVNDDGVECEPRIPEVCRGDGVVTPARRRLVQQPLEAVAYSQLAFLRHQRPSNDLTSADHRSREFIWRSRGRRVK